MHLRAYSWLSIFVLNLEATQIVELTDLNRNTISRFNWVKSNYQGDRDQYESL